VPLLTQSLETEPIDVPCHTETHAIQHLVRLGRIWPDCLDLEGLEVGSPTLSVFQQVTETPS
jgi:hypothetical protein